jgi:hypothetical protein
MSLIINNTYIILSRTFIESVLECIFNDYYCLEQTFSIYTRRIQRLADVITKNNPMYVSLQ